MRLGLFTTIAVLAACNAPGISRAVEPPQSEICRTLAGHPEWAEAARAASAKWSVPAPLLLAFVRQESDFRADAGGPAAAGPYGFAQATARTWQKYKDATDRPDARRNDFAAAMDFVGWYVSDTYARTGAPYSNIVRHYLAYSRGPAASGPATLAARRNAARVATYAERYKADLAACPLAPPEREQEQASLAFFGE